MHTPAQAGHSQPIVILPGTVRSTTGQRKTLPHAMFAYEAATPPPDIPIETHIQKLLEEGKAVAESLFESHRIRAHSGQITDPPAWEIRLHLEAIHDELELCLSAWESQRI